MNERTILRIYLTSGSVSYNDEYSDKLIEISFINRRKFQIFFVCIFFLLFAVFSSLGHSFSLLGKIIASIYLVIDMFMLIKNVKFREQEKGFLFYADFNFLQKLRMSQVGIINIFIFALLF